MHRSPGGGVQGRCQRPTARRRRHGAPPQARRDGPRTGLQRPIPHAPGQAGPAPWRRSRPAYTRIRCPIPSRSHLPWPGADGLDLRGRMPCKRRVYPCGRRHAALRDSLDSGTAFAAHQRRATQAHTHAAHGYPLAARASTEGASEFASVHEPASELASVLQTLSAPPNRGDPPARRSGAGSAERRAARPSGAGRTSRAARPRRPRPRGWAASASRG